MAVEPTRTSPGVTLSVGEETRSQSDTARTVSVPVSPLGADAAVEIDGYEILGELGRGGMGVVYRARHRTLNRPTAVKMIRGDDDRGLQRFLAEAEAIAAVHDPHVVPVYEFGHAGGRAYLALELCPGGTLADRLRRGPKFSTREAVTLLRKVAGGVAAAHAAGVVHRDLKPGNVLFDGAGEPKVSDFGLAKRVTGADLTATQAVMGSPAYMAPEQARGDSKFVGPQADVWALGVLLYELLAGKRPFAADDTWSLLQKVIRDEPVGVRTVNRDVPADLDTVIKKCLSKGPFERYASAAELAEDLDLWLAGKPVSARPAAWPERAVKWIRRNPLPTALAASLLVGAVTSVGFGLSARAEAARARAEEGKKDEALTGLRREKQNVEAKYTVTMAALDTMSDDVLEKKYFYQLGTLGPDELAFLEKIIGLYEAATNDRTETPEARFQRAKALRRIANIRFVLGDLNGAERDYNAGREGLAELVANPAEGVDAEGELAIILTRLSGVYTTTGRNADAIRTGRVACDVWDRRFSTTPRDPEVRLGRAEARSDLAYSYFVSGDRPAALTLYREVRDDYRSIVDAAGPDAPLRSGYTEPRYQLARANDHFAQLLRLEGRHTEAGTANADARAMQKFLCDRAPHERLWRLSLANMHYNDGIQASAANDPAGAIAPLALSLALSRPLVAESPLIPAYRQVLAPALGLYALVLFQTNRPDEAKAAHAEFLVVGRRWVELSPEAKTIRGDFGTGLTNIALCFHERGDRGAAVAAFDEAWPHVLACLDAYPDNPHWPTTAHINRGGRFARAMTDGQYADALRVAEDFLRYSSRRADAAMIVAVYFADAGRHEPMSPDASLAERPSRAEWLDELALRYLERGCEAGYANVESMNDHKFEKIATLQRFRVIVDSVRSNATKRPAGPKP